MIWRSTCSRWSCADSAADAAVRILRAFFGQATCRGVVLMSSPVCQRAAARSPITGTHPGASTRSADQPGARCNSPWWMTASVANRTSIEVVTLAGHAPQVAPRPPETVLENRLRPASEPAAARRCGARTWPDVIVHATSQPGALLTLVVVTVEVPRFAGGISEAIAVRPNRLGDIRIRPLGRHHVRCRSARSERSTSRRRQELAPGCHSVMVHISCSRWSSRNSRTRSRSRPAAWRSRTGSSRGRRAARPGRAARRSAPLPP